MLPTPAGKESMEILVTPPTEDTPLVVTHDGATATTGEQELKDESRHSSDSSRASRSLPIASGNTGYVAVRPSVYLDMHAPMEVSTSVVLSFCQQNVLRHYFRLLAMVGWRPLVDTSEHVRCQPALQTLNVMHNVVVFVVLVLGHVLQYTACFRRDSIVSNRSQAFNSAVTHEGSVHGKHTTCGSSSFAVYVLPAIMQVAAYAIALVHTRSHENEQFQSLVEKVFLQLTPADVWNVAKKRIKRRLHAVYAAGILWIGASLASQMLNIFAGGTLRLQWMYVAADDQDLHYYLLVALVVMLLFRDIVSMTIATSYAIHCQLLLVYLQNMSQAVRERRMTFLEFYRGVEEARKGVHYLNQRQALAVTVQTIWVTSRTVVCFYALLGTPWTHWIRFVAAWLNVFVWFSLVLIPLVQASRLSSTCRHVRELGLELTARPFVYRDLPQSELDSFLLFTTSLRMHAKLCALPITKRTVIFVFLFIGASLFIFVQLDIVRFRP